MTGPHHPPSGEQQPTQTTSGPPSAPQTRIIRRAPTTPIPQIVDNSQTTHLPPPPPLPQYGLPGPPAPRTLPGEPSNATAAAASAVSIVSGWATSVVATDLIAGWWKSDRLFCVAVGFLALVFALATVAGVILLLLRRSLSRYLIVAGAVIAVLTYLGVFIAGARVAWIVHTLPILPIASAVLALLPRTKDWLLDD